MGLGPVRPSPFLSVSPNLSAVEVVVHQCRRVQCQVSQAIECLHKEICRNGRDETLIERAGKRLECEGLTDPKLHQALVRIMLIVEPLLCQECPHDGDSGEVREREASDGED